MTNPQSELSSGLLVLDDLSKIYPRVTAVDHLNLTIDRAEFFGLLGPNGAGKTTTVRMISTLTPKSSGDIRIFGQSIDRDLAWIKRRIGVVPQKNNLENDLTGWENLELHGMLYGMGKRERRARIEELLEFTDLTDRRNEIIKAYSGGMKRKIMIARALMHNPDLLLLDEPTVGLDAGVRRKIADLLRQLKQLGLTVLLTTHYIEEAELLCDRVGLMYQGKLVNCDTPRALVKMVGDFAVDHFFNNRTETFFFANRSTASDYASALPGTASIRRANLEDVFLHLTSAKVSD